MIKVNVLYNADIISEVKITGHADYADFGKDIVCAAVSSIVTTTINNILTLDNNAIKYDSKEGKILITQERDNEIANKLLNTMLSMLRQLATTYPNNIKIGGLQWIF